MSELTRLDRERYLDHRYVYHVVLQYGYRTWDAYTRREAHSAILEITEYDSEMGLDVIADIRCYALSIDSIDVFAGGWTNVWSPNELFPHIEQFSFDWSYGDDAARARLHDLIGQIESQGHQAY